MIEIQTAMARRCVELLALSGPSLVLDVGCGSGLSGMVLAEQGHTWIGLDISIHMLNIANERRITPKIRRALKEPRYYRSTKSDQGDNGTFLEIPSSSSESEAESLPTSNSYDINTSSSNTNIGTTARANTANNSKDDDSNDAEMANNTSPSDNEETKGSDDESDEELVKYARAGDLLWGDMGQGVPFRPGCFDACISVSALQWLCNQDRKSHRPIQRINRFFQTLYACLVRGGKAVLQVYPENPHQMELLTSAAMRQGFQGGLVVDFPHSTRAKKFFLVLFAGMLPTQTMPRGLGTDHEDPIAIKFERERRRQRKRGDRREHLKHRDWVLRKKEQQRRQGKEVRPDTKYTGRKRRTAF